MGMPSIVTLDDLAAMISADTHGNRYETSCPWPGSSKRRPASTCPRRPVQPSAAIEADSAASFSATIARNCS